MVASEESERSVSTPNPDPRDGSKLSDVESVEIEEKTTQSHGVRDEGMNGSDSTPGSISPQYEALVSNQREGFRDTQCGEVLQQGKNDAKRQKRYTSLDTAMHDEVTPQLDISKDMEGSGPEMTPDTEALRWRIRELEAKLSKAEHEKSVSSVDSGSYVDAQANPILLQQAVESSRKAVGNYSRMVFQHLKISLKGEVGKVLLEDETDTLFHRPAHVKLVLEARISAEMFTDFENESYVPGGASQVLDRLKRSELMMVAYRELADMEACGSESDLLRSYITRIVTTDPLGRWGEAKWMAVQSMIGHISEKNGDTWVSQSWNESTGGMRLAWVKMCYSLRALHALAFAFHPHADIKRATKGQHFDRKYMELVDCCKDSDVPRGVEAAKVAFMTHPMFSVRDTVVRSQVYPGWGKSQGDRRAAL